MSKIKRTVNVEINNTELSVGPSNVLQFLAENVLSDAPLDKLKGTAIKRASDLKTVICQDWGVAELAGALGDGIFPGTNKVCRLRYNHQTKIANYTAVITALATHGSMSAAFDADWGAMEVKGEDASTPVETLNDYLDALADANGWSRPQ